MTYDALVSRIWDRMRLLDEQMKNLDEDSSNWEGYSDRILELGWVVEQIKQLKASQPDTEERA